MKLSTDRILTTHVGSLPRPDYLADALLAREHSEAVDEAAFATAVRQAMHIDLPEDKVLMPSVIDTCSNYVEHPDDVAERICRYAGVVGRERVLAGTDCGFSTFTRYGRVAPEIAYEKLKTLAAGAEIASQRLWGR